MADINLIPTQTFASGNTVTPATLNLLAQSTVALTAGTIVAGDIASDAVTTVKILNANVTTAKIADTNVTAAKLNGVAKDGSGADIAVGTAPVYGCRAWVNFDGTAGTTVDGEFRCTINGRGNVSKVVRTATGSYTVTFTAAIEDANYAATTGYTVVSGINACRVASQTSTGCDVFTNTTDGTTADAPLVSLAIFR